MATFAGADLELDRGSGAAFQTTTKSDDQPFVWQLPSGPQVYIPANSTAVVVTRGTAGAYSAALAEAREAANQVVDLYFAQGGRPLILEHKDSPDIVWWKDNDGVKILRIVGKNYPTSRFRATGVVTNSSGQTVLAEPKLPVWHESLRYYRLAEGTNDLLDSFRNLYLAIEAVLSTVFAPAVDSDGKRENESKWLLRVLRRIGTELDLADYAPEGPGLATNKIHRELYRDLRTAIFHAKYGRRVWLPQDWSSRMRITEARVRYSNMFRRLSQHYLDLTFPSGGLARAGWEAMAAALSADQVVYVSDDPTRTDDEVEGQYGIAPAGGRVFELQSFDADMSGDWSVHVAGRSSGAAAAAAVGGIRRFGSLRSGDLMMVEHLYAPLSIEGLDHLQVVLLLEGRNYGAPRRDFQS